MNKTELVETIARRTDLPKKDVEAVLNTFFEVAAQVVAKGKETLTIPGWMKIEQTTRGARVGRNPQTGEEIKIKASKAVKITAGATLKAIAKGDKPAPK
jgi:DNA-binding protein HU-beta